MDEARRWVREGKYAEATERYAWLWDNMLAMSQGMSGVRSSFMVGEMTELVKKYPAAKERFAKLRDEAAAKMRMDEEDAEEPDAHGGLLDWVHLNDVVGESEKTLAWFDRAKQQMDFDAHYPFVGLIMKRWLAEHGRWADCAIFIRDAQAEVEQGYHRWKMTESVVMRMPARPGMTRDAEDMVRMFRDEVALMYAALVAAGRGAEADEALAKARGYDPGPKLIETVLEAVAEAGVAREEEMKMVEELAEGEGRSQLKERLNRAKPGDG